MTNCPTCGGTENVPVYEDYTARIVGEKPCPDCSTGDRKKVETKDTGEGGATVSREVAPTGRQESPPPTSDTEGCPSGLRERVANSSGESPAGSNPAPSASDPVDVAFSKWEDDEFVITLNGKPVGYTLHEKDAKTISRWLKSAYGTGRFA